MKKWGVTKGRNRISGTKTNCFNLGRNSVCLTIQSWGKSINSIWTYVPKSWIHVPFFGQMFREIWTNVQKAKTARYQGLKNRFCEGWEKKIVFKVV